MPPDAANPLYGDRIRAQHMLDAARQACEFAAGRKREDLDTDAMFARAVVHAIQEIGEAASKMTAAGRTRLGDVPWVKIVGMRHRLVHGYMAINYDLVWLVVERELPPLMESLTHAFADWPLRDPPAPDRSGGSPRR